MMAQQLLLPLKYHGKCPRWDGGKWDESEVRSFDTGTQSSHEVSCLWLISSQKLERQIKNEIQMGCLCRMKDEMVHYEAFTKYNESFNMYGLIWERRRHECYVLLQKLTHQKPWLPMPATIQTIHLKQAATPAATCDSKKYIQKYIRNKQWSGKCNSGMQKCKFAIVCWK